MARRRVPVLEARSILKLGLLMLMLGLLAGCDQVLAAAGGLSGLVAPTRTATILYTGYGRGVIDAHNVCT